MADAHNQRHFYGVVREGMIMATDTLPGAILIIAGLADPCGDIGTQYRYDLLPVPWDQAAFAETIVRAIEADKWTAFIEELEPNSHPAGVRCWLCTPPESQILQPLLGASWNTAQENRAAKLIDRIAAGAPVFEFVWTERPFAEAQLLVNLENNILKLLHSDQAR